jgi:dipeptidase D
MSVQNIEPKIVWSYFHALNQVPRPSKKEDRVIQFIMDFGHSLNLPTKRDEIGNVLITKPASAGMENRAGIILQSHLDMVHQKNDGTIFDFENDAIKMFVEGDWVKADGTTLGADNGLGVATMMAVLASTDLAHPAIEALFTIDEETGMTGALALKPNFLSHDLLINIDTEEDDEITIGCAGGADFTATKSYETIACPINNIGMKIIVNGLQGGHSGMDIDKGLGNANKIMVRILQETTVVGDAILCNVAGGNVRNAIPRECQAEVSVDPNTKDAFVEKLHELKDKIYSEYRIIEPNINIELQEINNPVQGLDPIEEVNIIHALYSCFHGVFRMSPQVKGLVETSNNLAKIEVKNGQAKILCLSRSSVESSKSDVLNQLSATFKLANFDVVISGQYPGWSPNINNPLLKVATETYKNIFSADPHVNACHAGLECGIIGHHYPQLQMISIGPTIKGAHSPDEKASISSYQKFWKYFVQLLANTPNK